MNSERCRLNEAQRYAEDQARPVWEKGLALGATAMTAIVAFAADNDKAHASERMLEVRQLPGRHISIGETERAVLRTSTVQLALAGKDGVRSAVCTGTVIGSTVYSKKILTSKHCVYSITGAQYGSSVLGAPGGNDRVYDLPEKSVGGKDFVLFDPASGDSLEDGRVIGRVTRIAASVSDTNKRESDIDMALLDVVALDEAAASEYGALGNGSARRLEDIPQLPAYYLRQIVAGKPLIPGQRVAQIGVPVASDGRLSEVTGIAIGQITSRSLGIEQKLQLVLWHNTSQGDKKQATELGGCGLGKSGSLAVGSADYNNGTNKGRSLTEERRLNNGRSGQVVMTGPLVRRYSVWNADNPTASDFRIETLLWKLYGSRVYVRLGKLAAQGGSICAYGVPDNRSYIELRRTLDSAPYSPVIADQD